MMVRVICSALLGVIGLSNAAMIMAEQNVESFDVNAFDLDDFQLPEFNEYSVPVVLTASRIQQHQSDVPASVTILDSDFILSTGAENVAEVLRYVPGMISGPDKSNNNDSVQYHGGIASFPKNLQVLVNGRSMYRSGLAAVSWYELPIALEDIRRIEIVRGPNSATYGANAYQAVVNIISKHPADTYGTKASIKGGNNGEENIYLSQGGRIQETDYRVSFKQKSTDQYAVIDDKEAKIIDIHTHTLLGGNSELEVMLSGVDSTRYVAEAGEFQANEPIAHESRLELGAVYKKDLSPKNQLRIQFYSTKYEQKHDIDVSNVPIVVLDDDLRALFSVNPELIEGDENLSQAFNDRVDAYTECGEDQACQTTELVNFQTYLAGLSAEELGDTGFTNIYLVAQELGDVSLLNNYLAALSPDEQASLSPIINRYIPNSAIDPLATVSGQVDAGLIEYRNDIEIQHTYIYSPQLTIVSGASFRQDVVESEHYLGGTLTNNTSRLFGSAKWQATQSWDLHLGLMAEKESDLDTVFAPRLAGIYKLSPSQSTRIVYSQSVRSPDLFEQYADWKIVVENIPTTEGLNGNTYYQSAMGPGELEHQLIDSYEVGYYGRLNSLDSEIDVRVFHEKLSDVIDQSQRLDGFETYIPKEITYSGIETQIEFKPFDRSLFRMAAAYVDGDTNSEKVELQADAQNRENVLLRVFVEESFSLSWLQDWSVLKSAVHYYSTSEMNPNSAGRGYDLQRLDAQLSKTFPVAGLDLNLALNIQHDLQDNFYVWGDHIYEEDTRMQVSMGVEF